MLSPRSAALAAYTRLHARTPRPPRTRALALVSEHTRRYLQRAAPPQLTADVVVEVHVQHTRAAGGVCVRANARAIRQVRGAQLRISGMG